MYSYDKQLKDHGYIWINYRDLEVIDDDCRLHSEDVDIKVSGKRLEEVYKEFCETNENPYEDLEHALSDMYGYFTDYLEDYYKDRAFEIAEGRHMRP